MGIIRTVSFKIGKNILFGIEGGAADAKDISAQKETEEQGTRVPQTDADEEWPDVYKRQLLNPVSCIPPSVVLILLAKLTIFSE